MPAASLVQKVVHNIQTCEAALPLLIHAHTPPQAGKITIIPGPGGNPLLPSIVSFLENGRVAVGQDAVELLEHQPANTIYGAKRFIGRK